MLRRFNFYEDEEDKNKYIIDCAIEHGNDNIKIGQKFKFSLINPKGLISTCIIKEYSYNSELVFECTINGDINEERISFEQKIILNDQIELFVLPKTISDILSVKGTFPSNETLEEQEEQLNIEENELYNEIKEKELVDENKEKLNIEENELFDEIKEKELVDENKEKELYDEMKIKELYEENELYDEMKEKELYNEIKEKGLFDEIKENGLYEEKEKKLYDEIKENELYDEIKEKNYLMKCMKMNYMTKMNYMMK